MWQLSYRPEVEDDVVAAAGWYDDKRRGLGDGEGDEPKTIIFTRIPEKLDPGQDAP